MSNMGPRGSFKNKYSGKKSRNNGKKQKFSSKKNAKYNRNNNLKRKIEEAKNDTETKRLKAEPSKVSSDSSDSDNEETETSLNQLLRTFDIPNCSRRVAAIDTDDSGSADDELSEDDVPARSGDAAISSDNNIHSDTLTSDNEDDLDLNEHEHSDEAGSAAEDPFVKHLTYDLHENLIESLKDPAKRDESTIEWPLLGKLSVSIPVCDNYSDEKSNFTILENKKYAPLGKVPTKIIPKNINLSNLHIKAQIHNNIKAANKELDNDEDFLTEFQSELFSIINNYQDLYFTERTFENGEEVRFAYCLHAINHVLKTRTKIVHHNTKLLKRIDVPEEFRDQGLVRPKVLIIVPFRDAALRIVRMMIDILVPDETGQVMNKNRFMEDFSGNELVFPKKNPKPEDYELTFAGNSDDTFKIGIQITKKTVKLYADFYSSDIIIASPLGLRLVVGAEGEPERDHDFLASVEVMILDQTDLFLMQNWDHLLHVLDHLHKQPKNCHGTDFSRIRTWSLNGWAQYYRQTLIFSSQELPEISAIFNRRCLNYFGNVKSANPIRDGALVNVYVPVPQIFKRFTANDVTGDIDARFDFFINKILPQYRDGIMKQCLVYVSSYFDFVKVRNYFKREDVSFVQVSEYSEDAKVARARDMFFHGDAHFLVYSERFHYFRRIRIKGIRHIIFYQPPVFPHFYSELCNFMQEANQNRKCGSASNMSVSVIFSKYDYQRLATILGTERLSKIAASNNHFHMFTSSDA